MALVSSGQISWSDIRAEYGLSGQFSLGQCAGQNGGLPSSATAQVGAATFYGARYGPDLITMTKGSFTFGGTIYGYVNGTMGSVTSRSVKETTNQLVELYSDPTGGKSYIKITNHAQVWKMLVSLSDVWATKTWESANSRYYWNTVWWNNTSGTVAVAYYYNG